MMKLYCYDNSELAESEATSRGYRSDVYVKLTSGQIFQLHIYDITRLKKDFETEIEFHGFFGIEPNIILVKKVTIPNIKLTIEKLEEQRFFENLKPIHPDKIDIEKFSQI